MKKVFPSLVITLILMMSCGSKKPDVYLQLILRPAKSNAARIVDANRIVVEDYDFTTYTFNKQNFIYRDTAYTFNNKQNSIYRDTSFQKILDTLPLRHTIHLQTTYMRGAYGTTLPTYRVLYMDNGHLRKGIIFDKDIAYAFVPSAKDSSIIYMGKYVDNDKNEYTTLVIKAANSTKVLDEMVLDKDLFDDYDLYMYLAPSVKIENTGDILFCHYGYPSCGRESKRYYLTFKNKKFYLLCKDGNKRGKNVYTSIYFPLKKNNKYVLAEIIEEEYWDGKPPVTIPEEYINDANRIVLVEKHTFNGEGLFDITNDRVRERKWLKWDGEQMVELKIEKF